MAVMMAPPATRGAGDNAYAKLEERVLARDQVGASQVLYGLMRDGRPIEEMLRETVRIHAPYTHVPYHQRIDDGFPKFVNNDHCLLSARTVLRLRSLVSPELANLPLAQTVWYVPTGLDPWNQLIGKAPGHYLRMYDITFEDGPPVPQVHWPDQTPMQLDGETYDDRLNQWLTLVQRGEVLPAYRAFLGLFEDAPNRERLMAHLMFAGLIDVQDRMIFNRSYTTGHKSYRARATVELGRALGWDNARDVLYAGVPDIAVGPRWHSNYEAACQVTLRFLDGRDADYRANTGRFSRAEQAAWKDLVLNSQEPDWIHHLTGLLKAGKGIREILDVCQVAAAELILETGHPNNYSMPQHSYEYTNTLRWFFDNFTHQHQVKLLYVAASFVNQAAHHQRAEPGNGGQSFRAPRGASGLSQAQLLARLDEAIIALRAEESVALTAAYLRNGYDRQPLVTLLATAATKFGNDPHNQEIGLCLLEDYGKSTAAERDRLLLACAKHTAGHRKYGDPLEAYRRFAEAFGITTRQESRGDGDPIEALLDD
jgi:hypothetical protein